jgi:hypothetical protein
MSVAPRDSPKINRQPCDDLRNYSGAARCLEDFVLSMALNVTYLARENVQKRRTTPVQFSVWFSIGGYLGI